MYAPVVVVVIVIAVVVIFVFIAVVFRRHPRSKTIESISFHASHHL